MRTPESAQAGRQRRRLVLVAIAVCAPWVLAADGPTTAPAADPAGRARDPLATKQQIVRDRMTQLEDRMFRLTEKLSQAEPEQAARLQAAMKQAQELLIRRNMDDAIELLEERKLTDAADRQAAALKGLENVLKLLLEEGDNTKARQSEIDRLQQYRNQVQDLLDTERKLKAQADAAPRLAATLATIRAAIGKLETLIQRQAAQTGQTATAGAQAEGSAADKLGAEQKSIREETQDVGKMLQRPTAAPTVPAESGAEPSPVDQPSAHAGGASRPDGQPSSPQGGQQPNPQGGEQPGQPGGQQSGQSDQNQQSPGGQSPSPGDAQKNTDGAPKDEKREADIEAGIRQARGDVEQAAGEMQAAESELGRKDAPAAVPMQKKAQESLRRALQELKKQEQETRRQLDQAQAAKRQRDLRERARELAERMRNQESPQQEDAKPGKQQSGGQQQGGQQEGGQQQGGQQQGGQQQGNQQPGNQQQNSQRPQAPTPGNENVERAGEHMDKAADELDQDQPKQASPEQQQALEQLEQAQRELEQALDQLRREQQEEILRGLESRFRTMLAAQLLINEGTLALEQQGPATWAHAEELKLASLAHDQTGVVDQAGQALHILREEGTTVVFPRIVEQMREDMTTVAELLVAKKTGVRTQRIQGDIVVALKELIDAVKEMRKKVQEGESPGGQEGSGAGQNQNPPLLPGSAELKLLRSCQQRVSRQTSDFGTEHENPDELDVEAKAQLEQITHRQEEVAEMARKMHERLTGQ